MRPLKSTECIESRRCPGKHGEKNAQRIIDVQASLAKYLRSESSITTLDDEELALRQLDGAGILDQFVADAERLAESQLSIL